ncbi:MAG: BatA and WFA domain-containing protein [Vicinamibacteria bacterium]|nr:BatA and WFA domain-containing protein [Vicinamibacteria bacterium]
MGLGFLSPLFLLGALTVAIPVVLHLFRRRNDPVVPFSAMRFLRQVPIEQARRRRLQDLLLLALRVAALLLLAIGFARPYLQSPMSASQAGVTVVAVDVSASMGDAIRFARATTLATQAIDKAPAGDQVAVVQFASRADVLVEPGPDRNAARAAIARLQPSFGPTRYHAAIARGLDVVGARTGRLVLVTDLQSSGWTSADAVGVPARVSIEVADVGPLPPNVGIAALDRVPQGVRVGLSSTGASRAVDVELSLDGRSAGRQRVTLPADGTGDVLFAGLTATAGVVRAQLGTPDGIPADDQRWLVLDSRPGVRAAIIASPGAGLDDAVYVRRALEAAEGSAAWRVEVRPADRVQDGANLSGVAVAVLVGTAGLDRRGAEALGRFVEQGGGLLVAVGPGVNVELLAAGLGSAFPRLRVGPPAETPYSLVPTDGRHPIFRLFDPDAGAFDQARFSRIATIATTAPSNVIARFDNGAPALVDQAMGKGRLGVFASDLSNRWNDLVLQPAFVPWVVETASWLAANHAAPTGVVAGDGVTAQAQRPGVIDWRPTAAAGAPATRLAVNVAAQESDPRRVSAAAFVAQVTRDAEDRAGAPAAARRQEAEQGWWRYGLALMLIGLVVESAIGRRG